MVGGGGVIGGLFILVDEDNKIVIDKDVIIELMLVYFGYMFCLDVCLFDVVCNVEVVEIFEG